MDININKAHKQEREVKPKRSRGDKKDRVKVVYISTPMKVKTCASRFRAIVQELTGRESDVVRIMESSGGVDTWTVDDGDQSVGGTSHVGVPPLDCTWSSSPSCSEELIGPFVTLDSTLFFGQFCHQLDAIGSS